MLNSKKTDLPRIFRSLASGRDLKFPTLDLIGLSLLVAAMAFFLYRDPFSINHKILDFLRLRFSIFTKEPRLLFYASIHIGAFIAKAVALVLIMLLLAVRRFHIEENIAVRTPEPGWWRKLLLPFVVVAVGMRIYYIADPLMPNLPIRMVFPEAMLVANAVFILSAIFMAPVAEEIIYRGYMFDVLKRSFGSAASVLLTSVLFAAAHLPQLNFEILDFGIILMLGLLFGVLREKTGSVLVPIAFHGIYNIISVVVGVANYFISGY